MLASTTLTGWLPDFRMRAEEAAIQADEHEGARPVGIKSLEQFILGVPSLKVPKEGTVFHMESKPCPIYGCSGRVLITHIDIAACPGELVVLSPVAYIRGFKILKKPELRQE